MWALTYLLFIVGYTWMALFCNVKLAFGTLRGAVWIIMIVDDDVYLGLS